MKIYENIWKYQRHPLLKSFELLQKTVRLCQSWWENMDINTGGFSLRIGEFIALTWSSAEIDPQIQNGTLNRSKIDFYKATQVNFLGNYVHFFYPMLSALISNSWCCKIAVIDSDPACWKLPWFSPVFLSLRPSGPSIFCDMLWPSLLLHLFAFQGCLLVQSLARPVDPANAERFRGIS